MARQNYEFTSLKSVSEGHPDKVCDRISDEIVDLFFREGAKAGLDPYQIRVACETLATTNRVVMAGEVRGPKISNDEIEAAARSAIKDIGYEQDGFHWRNAKVEVLLHAQSADIAQGVDAGGNKDEGAGDQGIMFGYACRETPEFMPAPLCIPHEILKGISKARHSGAEKTLGPDAKSQVTVRYQNGKPVEATQIVVSHQHLVEVPHIGGCRRPPASIRQGGAPRGLDYSENGLAHQSNRQVLYWGPRRRQRPDGAKGSSSIRTAARLRMAAARFPVRIPRRSTAQQLMRRDTSPRTSSQRAWLIVVRSSSRTQSGWRARSQFTPT